MTQAAPAGRRLLLAQSALQIVLAAALAQHEVQAGVPRACLAFVPDVLDPAMLERALTAWQPASPFEAIHTFTPPARSGPAHRRDRARLRSELLALLDRWQPDAVAVFNDRQEPGQTVLVGAAQRWPHARREAIEDGAIAYTGFTYRRRDVFARARLRLALGRGAADVRVLGTHPLVQRFWALHPELLRAELKARPVAAFPVAAIHSEALRGLATAICASAGFEPATMAPGLPLLTLNHSSYAERNPDYLRLVQACVAALVARGRPFHFKYHPREREPDFLGLRQQPQAHEVARTLPIECLYLLLRGTRLDILGAMSTTLMTGALMLPEARIAALTHASAAGDRWDPALCRALRMDIFDDGAALPAWLDAG